MRPPPTVRRGHPPTLGWASLVVLLLMVNPGTQTEDLPECSKLPSTSNKTVWLKCEHDTIRLVPEEGDNAYPIVDISDFTEEDYRKFTTVIERNMLGRQRFFTGNLVCSGSNLTKISDINFYIRDQNIPQSVLLENNLKLTTVDFPLSLTSPGTIKFTVANNKILSRESIANLNAMNYTTKDSYIQEYGECVIEPGDQKSFAELENCYYIKGDLVINNSTDRSFGFPSTLEDVRGCISIKSTNLTNLDFLDNIKKSSCNGTHEVTNNKNLCIFPEEKSKLIGKFKEMNTRINIEDNNECKGECTWDYLYDAKDETCLIVKGTINLREISESENLTYLSQVEEIHGRLIIQNTELTTIAMFPNLHTIIYTVDKDYAVFIHDNWKLTRFEFPSLKNITTKEGETTEVFLVKDNNREFVVEDDQYEKISNLTGGRLTLPRRKPEPRVPIQGNNTEQSKKDSSKKASKKEEEKTSTGTIVGIVVGCAVVAVIVVVFGVIIFICYRKTKRGMQQKKKMEVEHKQKKKRTKDPNRRAQVANWNDVRFSLECAHRMKDDKSSRSLSDNSERRVKSNSKTAVKDDWDIRKEAKEYQNVSSMYLENAGNYANLECTRTTDQFFMDIIRDKLDIEDIEEGASCIGETMISTKRVWIHNMKYSLNAVRPKMENCKPFKYSTENINVLESPIKVGTLEQQKKLMNRRKQFDPREFIAACMKSSNVYLDGHVVIAAFDYCLKEDSFNGNDANQLLSVTGPIHIVGDTHGSLIDLQAVLSLDPNSVYEDKGIHPICYYKYLFLGDYLDRGTFDIVCFALVCVLRCFFKDRFYILRGNHEWMTGNVDWSTRIYDFYPRKCADEIRYKILKISSKLPIAALVNDRVFAAHGGICMKLVERSKKENKGLVELLKEVDYPMTNMETLETQNDSLEECLAERKRIYKKLGVVNGDTTKIDFKTKKNARYETELEVLACRERKLRERHGNVNKFYCTVECLLWSDPSPMSHELNMSRHCGTLFNENDVNEFLAQFKLDLIVRGHQMFGFSSFFSNKLISVFASFDNRASIIGVPYFFSNKEFEEHIKKIPEILSLGVLRIEPNGTLKTMLFRHLYLSKNEKKKLNQRPTRPTLYEMRFEEESQKKPKTNRSKGSKRESETKQLEQSEDSKEKKKKKKKSNSNTSANSKYGAPKSSQGTSNKPPSELKSKSEASAPSNGSSKPSSANDPKSKSKPIEPSKDAKKK